MADGPESMEQRRDRGVALLDSEQPGWRSKVDGPTLRMRTCHDCVLGQLFGSYQLGRQILGASGKFEGSASDHGFMLKYGDYTSDSDIDEAYAALDDLWKRVLT